jgi:hypothetical protein
MNSEELAQWLEQHIGAHVPAARLDRDRTQVRHVLNWGGFSNHSFTISDGSSKYHLKITNEQDGLRRLQRWRQMHVRLEERYRSPKVVDWVEFPAIGFAGLLFEHINGTPADFCRDPDLLREVIALAGSLHEDVAMRERLAGFDSAETYLDYFVATYIGRFTEDLNEIEADRPPFITAGLFQWMKDETLRFRDKAASAEAFHLPAIEPVHGDLHEGNVIVTSDGWFVVDWDDLALGDPALETAILVWPLVWQGKDWQDFVRCKDAAFADRLDLCLRAQLLDEVIDNIADYVQAKSVPSRQAEVQLAKRRRHEEALRRYGS